MATLLGIIDWVCRMETRRTLDAQAYGLMLMVSLSFGMQQIAIKAAAADIAPILQIALRSGVGAMLVAAYMLVRREWFHHSDGSWRPGLVVGALFALEYLFLGEGLRYTTAAHAVVFLYSAPIFAALGLHWKLPSERLSVLQWAGITLAFGGIAISFFSKGDQAVSDSFADIFLGDFLALLGGAAWGATTVVIRASKLAALPAKQTLFYQLSGAVVLLIPYAIITGQTGFNPTPVALASIAFQSLMISFLVMLLWFWLLTQYLASRLGVLSFMTPMIGVVLGAWLLNEPVESGFLFGSLLVLAGITLVSGDRWFSQLTRSISGTRRSAN